MELIILASFLVAFTVALGAIPFARRVQSKVGADDPMRSLPGVGGYAIVLGLFIATFYGSLIPEAAVGLGKASIVALLLAAIDDYAAKSWKIAKNVRTVGRFVVIMAVTLSLLTPRSILASVYMPHILVLLFVLTLLPLSIARLGVATEREAPCRTTYLFCIMITGLLILADHTAFRTDAGPRAWAPIVIVLTPLLGTLLACLIHMSDIQRHSRSIALGHGGHFVLGFALSWAALLIASTTAQPTITTISISFIVASPLFLTAARLILSKKIKIAEDHHVDGLQGRLAVFGFVSTTLLVIIGLTLMYLSVHWLFALLSLPLTFLAYTSALAHVLTSEPSFGSEQRTRPEPGQLN